MFRRICICLLLSLSFHLLIAQPTCQNIIIISTDGYRWQELFTGADSSLLFNPKYVADTSMMHAMYWHPTAEMRREKLMPFIWNFVEKKGQIWGNRLYHNNVSVANPYRLSYAGYNEILTGFADPTLIRNVAKDNKNKNVLDFFNGLDKYKNKVAFFGSWKLFENILHQSTSSISINCGYQSQQDDTLSTIQKLTNNLMQWSENQFLPTRTDLLTHTLALEYLQKHHPSIMHIAFGETDEYAHQSKYDQYLQKAHQFDMFLAEIWAYLQSDAHYKNNTTLFITTDHGRGASNWASHGPFVPGSQQSWLIQLGPNILPLGEIKDASQITANQFAQTIASYLGQVFTANHSIAKASQILLEKNNTTFVAK
jgi:Type I phosphodiesterase / nucleotide pyrophosphatase